MAETGKGAADKAAPGFVEGGASMRIDTALVRELAELLSEINLNEIEVEDGDRKIKVKREPAAIIGAAPSAPAQAAPAAAAAPAVAAVAPAEAEATGNAVKSPMVGTAYLSAEPGGAPFVAVGDSVKAGDTLLIVEAMKVMNPITAPEGGVVKKILVSDAQPVEYDQPLVVIG
jgi:acetyl-CoA carboxylase biotin carboxyl carrier protein